MVTNNMPFGKLDSFFPKSKTRREKSYEAKTSSIKNWVKPDTPISHPLLLKKGRGKIER
jgi:hypothetical protein